MPNALSDIETEVLMLVWRQRGGHRTARGDKPIQSRRSNHIRGLTLREMEQALAETHFKRSSARVNQVVRAIIKRQGLLVAIPSDPSQWKAVGQKPVAFTIPSDSCVTYPTSARVLCTIYHHPDGIDRQQLSTSILGLGIRRYQGCGLFTENDLEEALAYCRRLSYIEDVPDTARLRGTSRLTLEMPFVMRLAAFDEY